MPKLMGATRPLPWLASSDVGIIVAKAFAAPEEFIGRDIRLASDVKSLDECRTIYREVMGKKPSRFPMPVWLFKRFVGSDLITMWTWLRTAQLDLDTGVTHEIHPGALSVKAWLREHRV
jgi:hypothetical protein